MKHLEENKLLPNVYRDKQGLLPGFDVPESSNAAEDPMSFISSPECK